MTVGKYFFLLSELISRPIIPVLLGWTVKNIYDNTQLKTHRVVLRGLFGAASDSPGSHFEFFSRKKSVLRSKYAMFLKLGQKIMDFRGYLAKNHEVVKTGKLNKQTNYESIWRNGKVRQKALGKLRGDHFEGSIVIGVFCCPAE